MEDARVDGVRDDAEPGTDAVALDRPLQERVDRADQRGPPEGDLRSTQRAGVISRRGHSLECSLITTGRRSTAPAKIATQPMRCMCAWTTSTGVPSRESRRADLQRPEHAGEPDGLRPVCHPHDPQLAFTLL